MDARRQVGRIQSTARGPSPAADHSSDLAPADSAPLHSIAKGEGEPSTRSMSHQPGAAAGGSFDPAVWQQFLNQHAGQGMDQQSVSVIRLFILVSTGCR